MNVLSLIFRLFAAIVLILLTFSFIGICWAGPLMLINITGNNNWGALCFITIPLGFVPLIYAIAKRSGGEPYP